MNIVLRLPFPAVAEDLVPLVAQSRESTAIHENGAEEAEKHKQELFSNLQTDRRQHAKNKDRSEKWKARSHLTEFSSQQWINTREEACRNGNNSIFI